MSQLTSRRAFLSAKVIREDSHIVRPPGSVRPGFADQCSRCGDCAEACPESIISFDSDGFPVFEPSDNPCTFCGDCAVACPTDALHIERLTDWPWRAAFNDGLCLSMNGISCRTCQDNCEQNAIRFRLQLRGRAKPSLDVDACNGCGGCVSLCPVDAITLKHQPIPQTEGSQ